MRHWYNFCWSYILLFDEHFLSLINWVFPICRKRAILTLQFATIWWPLRFVYSYKSMFLILLVSLLRLMHSIFYVLFLSYSKNCVLWRRLTLSCWTISDFTWLQLRPNFSDAWANLGSAYMRKGRLNEAAQCCRQALALNPALVGLSFIFCPLSSLLVL